MAGGTCQSLPPPAPVVAPSAAPAAPPGTVQLQIDAPKGNYDVSVTAAGGASLSCRAPCTMHVKPGPATLLVTGDASISQTLAVPNAHSTVLIHRKSKGRLVTGLVLSGVGGTLGIVALANQNSGDPDTNMYLAVVGLGCALTGLVLVLTAGKDRVTTQSEVAGLDHPRIKQPSVAVWATPAAGGGGVVGGALRF